MKLLYSIFLGKGSIPRNDVCYDCVSNISMMIYQCIFVYLQADLCPDDVMLLDAWDTVFIWIGAGANKTERDNAEKVAIVSI